MDLLRRNTAIAERRARRLSAGRRGDGAEAHDRARCPDDAVEACARDLVQVLADFGVDVTDQLALVARFQRIGFDEALGQPDDAELEAASEFDGGAGASRHFDAAAADVDDDRGVARPR